MKLLYGIETAFRSWIMVRGLIRWKEPRNARCEGGF
jgi:hypothetical protein